jgi:hypothetical protein
MEPAFAGPPSSKEPTMMGWTSATLLSLCLGLGVATAATAADAPGKAASAATAPTTWDNLKDFSHKEKDRAVAAGKQLIAATDRQIAELGKQAKNATGETKKAHEANMKELQAKKQAAQAELAKLGQASGEAWDATRTGFSDAGKALSAAYDKAAAAIRK